MLRPVAPGEFVAFEHLDNFTATAMRKQSQLRGVHRPPRVRVMSLFICARGEESCGACAI